ncbi:hypothetical protein BJX70DRAFT_134465 [Aspergillus crustosus]
MPPQLIPFKTLDVFTSTPFSGNPLAVVSIPPGTTLSQTQKQLIAKEFNLSETTFVHELTDQEAEAGAASSQERVFDIFTREAELPFAGHPTIGTAAVLYPRGVTRLRAKAGLIQLEAVESGGYRAEIPFDVRLHGSRLPGIQTSGSGSVPQAILDAENGAPLFSIVNGMAFALIELPSLEVLESLPVGGGSELPELSADLLDEGWSNGWVTRRYYFVRLGSETRNGKTVHQLRTRLVRRDMEDPGTGSAACALAGYLSLYVVKEQGEIGFGVTQGVEMGRVNRILVDTQISTGGEDGRRVLEKVFLGGEAVEVSRGEIVVPE